MKLHDALMAITKKHIKELHHGIKGAKRIRFYEFEPNSRKTFTLPYPISLIDVKDACIILCDNRPETDSINFIEIVTIKDHDDDYGLLFGNIKGIEYCKQKIDGEDKFGWDLKADISAKVYNIHGGYDIDMSEVFIKHVKSIGKDNLSNIVTAIHNIHFCT